jgi:hypothetical protein
MFADLKLISSEVSATFCSRVLSVPCTFMTFCVYCDVNHTGQFATVRLLVAWSISEVSVFFFFNCSVELVLGLSHDFVG